MGAPTIAHLYRMEPLRSLAGGSSRVQKELPGLMRSKSGGKSDVTGGHEQICYVPEF